MQLNGKYARNVIVCSINYIRFGFLSNLLWGLPVWSASNRVVPCESGLFNQIAGNLRDVTLSWNVQSQHRVKTCSLES